jgi:glyceraldehyde 3-phosphate dehydrogenase
MQTGGKIKKSMVYFVIEQVHIAKRVQSMGIKVAINGLGRIGRQTLRRLLADRAFELTAVNDAAKPDLLAYLLNHEFPAGGSALGARGGTDFISLKGKSISVFAETDPARLPWKKLKVDLVLECTGLFDTGEKAGAHINAGARKVLIAGPAADGIPAIVYGLNEKTIRAGDRIISAASPSLNCLALLAKALNESAPIRSGIALSLQESGAAALEGNSGKKDLLRAHRNGEPAIIPASPDWAGPIGRLIPELAGKLSFSAQRLPVDRGALVLLFAVVESGDLSAEKLNQAMKAKSGKVLGYNEEEIVSSDAAATACASLFDATQTLVQPLGEGLYQVQAASWHDPANGYAAQLLRIAGYFAESGKKAGTAKTKPVLPKPPASSPEKTAAPPKPRKPEPEKAGIPLPRKPLINFPK